METEASICQSNFWIGIFFLNLFVANDLFNIIGGEIIESDEEYLKLFLHSKEGEKLRIKNTISNEIMRKSIKNTFLKEEDKNKIKLTMISSKIGAFFFNKMKRRNKVITNQAGPALNMKILGKNYNFQSTTSNNILIH